MPTMKTMSQRATGGFSYMARRSVVEHILKSFRDLALRGRRFQRRSHPFGDDAVAALRLVLVAQRGLRCRVSQSRHEFGERGASLRCEHRAGVA